MKVIKVWFFVPMRKFLSLAVQEYGVERRRSVMLITHSSVVIFLIEDWARSVSKSVLEIQEYMRS